ncbi:MAG TPA: ABC-type transport auxiliary lipoprotein family protein [Rhizomicrobium sp.]|jgi:cholesterol transport system auxiliary component|nr:ABC-type transport auxiliary lipoprotein family protein [Rhizomicrobium sp.]
MANKRMDRRLVLFSASAFALAGCGGLGLGPTDTNNTIYLLEPAIAASGGQPATWALAVDLPEATDALDSRRIALIKPDATLDYYANAVWADRLPVLVQTALVAAFQAGGHVPSVTRIDDALHADYELGTEIRDCAAHYSAPDGVPLVTVSLVAQMSTAHGRKIIASFTAKQDASAGQNSTTAVVAAFNAALSAAIGQIVTWALSLPAPPGP